VGGDTCAAVAKTLVQVRSSREDLGGFDSVTDLDCRGTDLRPDGSILNFTPKLSVTLPRLASASPSPDLRRCFAAYLRRLEAHELYHVGGFRAALVDLTAVLDGPGDREQKRAAFEAIEAKVKAQEEERDRATDHGGLGCRFPPPECRHVREGAELPTPKV